jgi:hypothetical protein
MQAEMRNLRHLKNLFSLDDDRFRMEAENEHPTAKTMLLFIHWHSSTALKTLQ